MEEEIEKKEKEPFIVIPYVMGVSEELRRVCGKYGVRVTFKSGTSLRGSLTKVKDEVSIITKSNVVYSIACDCGKCYIGETERTLQKRLKEHKDACIGGMVERSAVADHAWSEHHRIDWNQVQVIDCANKRIELLIKEALHIAMIPDGACLNRDKGLELPDCWLSTIRALQNKKDKN